MSVPLLTTGSAPKGLLNLGRLPSTPPPSEHGGDSPSASDSTTHKAASPGILTRSAARRLAGMNLEKPAQGTTVVEEDEVEEEEDEIMEDSDDEDEPEVYETKPGEKPRPISFRGHPMVGPLIVERKGGEAKIVAPYDMHDRLVYPEAGYERKAQLGDLCLVTADAEENRFAQEHGWFCVPIKFKTSLKKETTAGNDPREVLVVWLNTHTWLDSHLEHRPHLVANPKGLTSGLKKLVDKQPLVVSDEMHWIQAGGIRTVPTREELASLNIPISKTYYLHVETKANSQARSYQVKRYKTRVNAPTI